MLEHFQWLPFLAAILILTMSPGRGYDYCDAQCGIGWLALGIFDSWHLLGFCHARCSALGCRLFARFADCITAFQAGWRGVSVYIGCAGIRSALKPVGNGRFKDMSNAKT